MPNQQSLLVLQGFKYKDARLLKDGLNVSVSQYHWQFVELTAGQVHWLVKDRQFQMQTSAPVFLYLYSLKEYDVHYRKIKAAQLYRKAMKNFFP